jgi:hypothetical protein
MIGKCILQGDDMFIEDVQRFAAVTHLVQGLNIEIALNNDNKISQC